MGRDAARLQRFVRAGVPSRRERLTFGRNAGVLVPEEPRSPRNSSSTSFETFVQDVFAAEYHGKAASD